MTFEQMLYRVKAGAKARRQAWGLGTFVERGELRTGGDNLAPVLFRRFDGYPHVETFEPASPDMFATDWEIIAEPELALPLDSLGPGEITWNLTDPVTGEERQVLKLLPDGRIYVWGRLAETDKEVVEAFRDFLFGRPPVAESVGSVRFVRVLREDGD